MSEMIPTTPGYYWAKLTEAAAEQFEMSREAQIVCWIGADHNRHVEITGLDSGFALKDFEWLAGPLVLGGDELRLARVIKLRCALMVAAMGSELMGAFDPANVEGDKAQAAAFALVVGVFVNGLRAINDSTLEKWITEAKKDATPTTGL